MPEPKQSLGGRLPLFDPEALTPPQKSVYDSIASKMVPWAESAGFKARLDSGELIGPFNTILSSPEIAAAFLALQASEQEHTLLSERVRQVIILTVGALTVGAVWKSDYERYAHSAVARKAGFSEDAIRALAQGDQADDMTQEEWIAQRFTWQLTAERHIGDELYAEAVAAFGARGIVDLIFLAGCYDTISSLLNAFRVPAPE